MGLVKGGSKDTSAPQVTSQTPSSDCPMQPERKPTSKCAQDGSTPVLVLNVTAEIFWEGATWRSKPALHVGAVADLPGKGPQGSRGRAVGGGVDNRQGRGRWGGWERRGGGDPACKCYLTVLFGFEPKSSKSFPLNCIMVTVGHSDGQSRGCGSQLYPIPVKPHEL